jgi:gamma-glutamylcysteine synthetase
MSNPGEEDATPITRPGELAGYFAAGAKPHDKFRIGTEHEKFGFRQPGDAGGQAAWAAPAYEPRGIHAMLSGIASLGWEEIRDQDVLIGLKKGGESVSLEPGGQFELSGAPVASLSGISPTFIASPARCPWVSRRSASIRWRGGKTCRSCRKAAMASCGATCRWSARWAWT